MGMNIPSAVRRNRVTDVFTTVLDALMAVCLLALLAIVVTGGWKGHLLQLTIIAHRPENPGLAVLVLLLLRKLIDRRTPMRNIPLIRGISRVLVVASRYTEQRPALVLTALVTGYTAIMGIVVCLKHVSFHSHAFDLGIFSQLIWSAANGYGLRSSILGHYFLGEHFSPILYLLVPGYSIWSHPTNLLIQQTIVLSLAAVPLYLLAKSELRSRSWGMLFAFLYLCYQPMRNVNMYDFHPIALATPLLMLAFYLLYKRHDVPFLFVLLVALACKEEIAEIVFIFGAYLFFVQRRRLFGAILSASGIAVFFILILAVIPSFRNAPYGFVGRYDYLGDDISSILVTLLTRPIYVLAHVVTENKLDYVWKVFAPVGFLSILSPSHLLLAVPTLMQNLLSDFPPQYSTSFQYTSALTPFVFISAVFGAKRLVLKRRTDVSGATPHACLSVLPAMLVLLSLAVMDRSPIWHIRQYGATQYSKYVQQRVLSLIPPDASVSAQGPFVPHLTSRRELYEFPVIKQADYILLDSRANMWPLQDEEYFRHVRELIKSPHRIVLSNGSLLLLERVRADSMQLPHLPNDFTSKMEPAYEEDVEQAESTVPVKAAPSASSTVR